jgi:AraC family transcriptional activator of pobA
MKKTKSPITVHSITELHRLNGVTEPEHPLISVVHYEDIQEPRADFSQGLSMDFYLIAIKKDVKGKIRYGQNYYDFDEGVLSFIAPGQICYAEENSGPYKGCMLMIHPDFFHGYSLAKDIKNFSFFSYAVNEALLLSKKEEKMIEGIFRNIETEYRSNIDSFSQPVMISQIELLLNYANRFYNRQFITRKPANHDLLTKLELLLDKHFNDQSATGLPSVKEVAEQLHVSSDYLSDMLRAHTGQNTQQHIHNKLIEKAKEMLSSSKLTVAEIAYRLGFEHPQSFNKMFKKKMNVSPMEFRTFTASSSVFTNS